MIYDSLENFKDYMSIHESFKYVSGFIAKNSLKSLKPARYELENGCYAFINEYDTKDASECFIECHRKYIDIQIMITGNEKIGVCNKKDCTEGNYDVEKDFSKLEGKLDFITLNEGYFVIFFPQDGHMPSIKRSDIPEPVVKIVFKIPVK